MLREITRGRVQKKKIKQERELKTSSESLVNREIAEDKKE